MNQSSLPRAIISGGLIGGALDLLFAVSFAAYRGAAPTKVFQAIASGVLGNDASAGGAGVSAFGIACHFVLSLIWAALFAGLAWQLPKMARKPLAAGIGFGLIVFLVMRLVVLPLSAYPKPVTFAPLATVLDLLSHMLLFGYPIAWFVGRSLLARRH